MNMPLHQISVIPAPDVTSSRVTRSKTKEKEEQGRCINFTRVKSDGTSAPYSPPLKLPQRNDVPLNNSPRNPSPPVSLQPPSRQPPPGPPPSRAPPGPPPSRPPPQPIA